MPVVTQLSPNFLGGVSKQNDDKKLAGQVSECINGYPDPTYGLLKRPGMKFINHLKDTSEPANVYNKADLENAVWFFLDRSETTSYIGAIKGSNIYAWNATTGKACNVTNNGASYLTVLLLQIIFISVVFKILQLLQTKLKLQQCYLLVLLLLIQLVL